MEDKEFDTWVGIDWGSESHQVYVVGSDGSSRGEKVIEHSGPGMAALVAWLMEMGEPARIAVAIEVPRGPVVEGLLDHAFAVFAINPKQLDRFRDRFTAAGAKDDRRDARVLASALRTDLVAFHRVELDSALVVQLREISRIDEELGRELRQCTNQLRDLLLRYFPQLLRLNTGADEPWLWSLLTLAPTPTQAARLTRAKLERLLKSHRIRRLSPDDLIAALRQTPLVVAPGVVEAASKHALLLVKRIELAAEQRRQCEHDLAALLDDLEADEGQSTEHRDVQVLRSLPGAGNRVVATMLGEASDALRQRNYHALRCIAGTAPVTRQSGKRRQVVMRHGCSGRLRNAAYYLGASHACHDPVGKLLYRELRSRGLSHPRAVRSIADRLLGIAIAMLKAGTRYDPSRRHRFAAVPSPENMTC
jgi:transposase